MTVHTHFSKCRKQASNKKNRIAKKHSGYKHKLYYKYKAIESFYSSEIKQANMTLEEQSQQNFSTYHPWVNSYKKLALWQALRQAHEKNPSLAPYYKLENRLQNAYEQKVLSIIRKRKYKHTDGDGNCMFYSLLGMPSTTNIEKQKKRREKVQLLRQEIAEVILSCPPILTEGSAWCGLLEDIQQVKNKYSQEEWKQVQQVLDKCVGSGSLEGEELAWVQQRLCELYSLVLTRGSTYGSNTVLLVFAWLFDRIVVVFQGTTASNNVDNITSDDTTFKVREVFPSYKSLDHTFRHADVITLHHISKLRPNGTRYEHYNYWKRLPITTRDQKSEEVCKV